MSSKVFEDAITNIPKETEMRVRMSIEIVERIIQILKNNNMNQNDLARLLGKSPSEISKWLSGTHNFTLKSIHHIEQVLGQPILKVVKQEQLSV